MNRPIPLPAGLPTWTEAHERNTLVTRWSGIDLDAPAPLVPRWTIRPGDVIVSSHYGRRTVAEVIRGRDHRHVVTFRYESPVDTEGNPVRYHDGTTMFLSEAYEGTLTVPVVHRAEVPA